MAKPTCPVKLGATYPLTITGLGHSGEGVGRKEDFTVFVPHTIPGETVLVEITAVRKTFARGKLQAMLAPSPARIAPRCNVYGDCGGCQLQHMTYAEQLRWKRQVVRDALDRIGKLPEVNVHPTLGAADPWHYRNKMQFPVGRADGRVVAGCYAPGTHTIVDTERCYIQHALNNAITGVVKGIVTDLGLSVYDETTGEGLLRHILGRVGVATGEVMVVLVTNGRVIPREKEVVARITAALPAVVSIVQNINTRRTNVILGDETRTLWGRGTITDYIGPFRFKVSAKSFFQVNTPQAEVLYAKAVEYAGLTGKETVIDAYCGTGTITLFLAQKARKVYGIEVVPEAIADAQQNAADNGVYNVEFMAGDATVLMPALYAKGVRPEVIVVDPPRKGCEKEVLATFAKMQPARIVYVSCNPASLARDLGILAELGYCATEVQPVDMFPQTSHVECVTLVTRVEK